MVTNWSFFINVLQTVSCSRRKLTYQAENGTFSGSLEIERKSQGVLMQRTLAWISAAWICSREAKAEGQPSPSCAVGKQRLSGQHTVELLDLLSRITSSKKKNQSWQTRKKLEWNMDEPPQHPSIETQLFGLGCANSIEHTGRHRVFFIVWCVKGWLLLAQGDIDQGGSATQPSVFKRTPCRTKPTHHFLVPFYRRPP